MRKIAAGSALCMLLFNFVYAQYKDTIWVPVTFYDFHSDGSNPEFECPHNGGIQKNMVADHLDSEGKPQLGSSPYINYYIKYWYRDWNISSKSDFTEPQYICTSNCNDKFHSVIQQSPNILKVDHDTAFKNIVIHDSLPFHHIGGGTYQYDNQNFFPLDGRYFGNESRSHNYSFTMELKCEFQKNGNQMFDFAGDDDVWVFVNGQLTLDLGGIHETAYGNFTMNQFPAIHENANCTLNVFYAERHTDRSDIKITTNIISSHSNLKLYPEPGNPGTGTNQPYGSKIEVKPGQPVNIYGHVFDSLGKWMGSDLDKQIKYEIDDQCGNQVIDTSNGHISYTPTSTGQNCQVIITASFTDPSKPSSTPSKTTLVIDVLNQPATNTYKMDLYAVKNPIGATPLPNKVTVTAGQAYDIYAHVFDTLGKYWGSLDTQVTWNFSGPSSGASLSINAGSHGSHQVFTGLQGGKEYSIIATFQDPAGQKLTRAITISVQNGVLPAVYNLDLYPGESPNGVNPLPDKVTITAGQTFDMYAHVFDTLGIWQDSLDKFVTWNFSGTSTGASLSTTTGSHQVFSGTQAGKDYTIIATYQGQGSQPATHSITISVQSPSAFKLDLYPGADPRGATPLLSRVEVTAGQSFDIYGHVFDTANLWKPVYDNVVTWKFSGSGTGASLSIDTGSHQIFKSTQAGTEYTIVATFQDPDNKARPSSTDQIIMAVKAAEGKYIDILTDTTNSKTKKGPDIFVFGQNQTTQTLYAVTRDQFGNFAGIENVNWQSGNPKAVPVSNTTNSSTTTITKNLDSAGTETFIIAYKDGLVPDTIKVGSKGITKIGAINPFTPGVTQIPPEVLNNYKNVTDYYRTTTGTLISIEPPMPLVPVGSDVPDDPRANYASVKVYDAVGNLIRTNLKLIKASALKPRVYGIIWDGTNINGRQVGSGAYLFDISGRQTDGKAFNTRMKIGVKKFN